MFTVADSRKFAFWFIFCSLTKLDLRVGPKKVDTAKVRVFATTPPYFDYNWTVRGGLDPALVKNLSDAFLKLDPANPEHKEILALQRDRRTQHHLVRARNSAQAGPIIELRDLPTSS